MEMNIPFSDEELIRVRQAAEAAGKTPEQFVKDEILRFARLPLPEAAAMIARILKEDEELYHRLAQH